MAKWNPSPKVAIARDVAKKLGADRVVILYTTPTRQCVCISFGVTKSLCANAKHLGDRVYDTARAFLVED